MARSVHPNRLAKAGPIQSIMSIHTTSSREPVSRVYLQALVQPVVALNPTLIVIPSTTKEECTRKIVISSKRSFSIARATCANPLIGVAFPTDFQSHAAEITLRIPELQSAINTTIELSLMFADGPDRFEARNLTVPIYRLSTNSEELP